MLLILIGLLAIGTGAVLGFKKAGKRIQASSTGLTAGQTLVNLLAVAGSMVAAFYLTCWAIVVGVWMQNGFFALLLLVGGIGALVSTGWFSAYLARFVHFGTTKGK